MLIALVAPGAGIPAAQPAPSIYRYLAPHRQPAPLAAESDERDRLIAAIRTWEGETVEQPPILFKATVALGSAMLAGAGLLVCGLAA